MAEAIAMPRLGWTMKEGTLVEWLKADGDAVEAGEILFTVESDKALNEIETFSGGILRIPSDVPQPGDTVPVGTLLGYLLQPGEEMPARPVAAPPKVAPAPAEPSRSPTSAPAAPVPRRTKTPTISPRARRIAAELGVEWPVLQGSGRTGRIVERDVRAAARSRHLARATGRRRHWSSRGPGAAARSRHLARATLTTEADATELVALRARFKAAQGPAAPTYNHLFAKMTAVALVRHPLGSGRAVHLGLVVDTPDGLVVPVLRDADAKSLAQLASEARDLTFRARRRTLPPAATEGATFAIANLGLYGIDAFAPMTYQTQGAFLGMGRIAAKPAVYQGQVVPRALMALNLTFDDRVLDSGLAARFLGQMRAFVEQPELWLRE